MTDRWRNIVLQWHATGLRRIPAIMTCQHPGVIHDNHLFQIHEPCSERGGSCGSGGAKRRGVAQIFLSWTSWRVSSNRAFPTTFSCLLLLLLSFFLLFVRSFSSASTGERNILPLVVAQSLLTRISSCLLLLRISRALFSSSVRATPSQPPLSFLGVSLIPWGLMLRGGGLWPLLISSGEQYLMWLWYRIHASPTLPGYLAHLLTI